MSKSREADHAEAQKAKVRIAARQATLQRFSDGAVETQVLELRDPHPWEPRRRHKSFAAPGIDAAQSSRRFRETVKGGILYHASERSCPGVGVSHEGYDLRKGLRNRKSEEWVR